MNEIDDAQTTGRIAELEADLHRLANDLATLKRRLVALTERSPTPRPALRCDLPTVREMKAVRLPNG